MVLTQAANTIKRDMDDEEGIGNRCRFISTSCVASKSLLEVGLDSEGHHKTIDSDQVFPSSFHLN
jgi:hypothetical protein